MKRLLTLLLLLLPTPPVFAQAEDNNQLRARLHTELAAAYYSRAQYGIALEEANIALSAYAKYAPAYNILGLVYMDLKEDATAEKHFEQALKLSPTDPDINNNYGWFLCQRQREDQSIAYFMAALKNPFYTTPEKSFVNAGICARKKGDDATAEEYFQKALKLQPTNPQALFNMADLSYNQEKYHEARRYMDIYSKTGQHTAESLWLGLRTEKKLGEKNAMESYSLQLRKNFPDSKEAKALTSGQF